MAKKGTGVRTPSKNGHKGKATGRKVVFPKKKSGKK